MRYGGKQSAVAAVAVAASAALAGCGTVQMTVPSLQIPSVQAAPPPAAHQSTTSAPRSTTSTPKSPATRTKDNEPSSPESGDPGACGGSALDGRFLSTENYQTGASDGWVTVTNHTSDTCYIAGGEYPKILVEGMHGEHSVDVQPVLDPKPTRLVLDPGQSATMELRWWNSAVGDPQARRCLPNAAELKVGLDPSTNGAGDDPVRVEVQNGAPNTSFGICDVLYIGGFHPGNP